MKAVYRVIAALTAAAAFPALYFLKLIHITIDLGFTDGYFDDSFSLQQIVDFFGGKASGLSMPDMSSSIGKTVAPLRTTAIVTAVFLAIMIIMAVAVIICSAFTNARKVNLAFSLVGGASTLGALIAFRRMTSLVIDGTVSLGNILNAFMSDSSSTIGKIGSLFGVGNAVSVIGELKLLQFDSAVIMVLIIFIFIMLWTAAFMLIDMDPYKADMKKASKKVSKKK